MASANNLNSPGCATCPQLRRCWVGWLTPDERGRVEPLLRRRPSRKGEVLQHEGAMPVMIRALRDGLVLRTRLGRDGQPRPVAIEALGGGLGALGYFHLHNQTSSVALGPGQVCEIPVDVLRRLEVDLPSLTDAFVHKIVQVLGMLATWSEVMRLRSVSLQLVYVLLLVSDAQGGACVQLPTQAVLASLLGATRETVARTLLLFEQEGVLQRVDRKQVQLNIDRLHQRLHAAAVPDELWSELPRWVAPTSFGDVP